MSQRSALIFAGVVAVVLASLVAGQGVDPVGCASKTMSIYNKFLQDVQYETQVLLKKLRQTGLSAANIDGLGAQADNIMQQVTAMTNAENGFDASKIVSASSQIFTSNLALASGALSGRPGIQALGVFIDYQTSMLKLYGQLISNIGNQCLPNRAHLEA